MASQENGNVDYSFFANRHIKFFKRCLEVLPARASYYDTSRMTILFFTLSGLDLLNAIDEIPNEDRDKIIEWIYNLEVISSNYKEQIGGFKGGTFLQISSKEIGSDALYELNVGHIAMTYTALALLVILSDDLSRVDRRSIMKHIKSLQCKDGSFYSTCGGSENDMRFLYCAAAICYMLNDFSSMNIDTAVQYILNSLSYEGGFGQGPFQESHGGSTYCAVSALYLMNKLDALSHRQVQNLVKWLINKQEMQDGGLRGRPNKTTDTCYTFWVGATLKLLNSFEYLDHKSLHQFVLSTQDPITGGFGKSVGIGPDGLHSYLAISGLSMLDRIQNEKMLIPVEPSLNISQRAFRHLQEIHKKHS